MQSLADYKREDGWLMVSKFAFGTTIFNRYTGETITISNQHD